ncbi:Olfactory receptor 14J1-like protein [Aix galericulata]|nr:Olfactory receptor 14J1-like protein [Aix galericulata]
MQLRCRAVLRIPSEQGRHKAFSTCLPHLAVVSLFAATSMFAYLKPPSISFPALDLFLTVLYVVLPPALNPLIYSMRNKKLKEALQKIVKCPLEKDTSRKSSNGRSISTTLPKAMANSLWDTRAISFAGCAAQVFSFIFFIAAEFYVLIIVAYDCYVAICKPLHYGSLLGSGACAQMAAAAWGIHFPCPSAKAMSWISSSVKSPHILKLSCSDTYLREAGLITFSFCVGTGCFVFIMLSYMQIFRTVLRMPSEQGWHKAFSMCLPHLAVVSLFVSTGMFAYLKPSHLFPSSKPCGVIPVLSGAPSCPGKLQAVDFEKDVLKHTPVSGAFVS